MIVQIYEVTTCAEARALGMMGVDHVGVLVGEGDSKTKTDNSDGSHTKDLQNVAAFVKAARGANCVTN